MSSGSMLSMLSMLSEPLDAITRTKTMERLEHVLVVTSKWN